MIMILIFEILATIFGATGCAIVAHDLIARGWNKKTNKKGDLCENILF
jgi:hypothetical protein